MVRRRSGHGGRRLLGGSRVSLKRRLVLHAGRDDGRVLLVHYRRRARRVGIVRHIRRVWHDASCVVRRTLGVVCIGVGVHMAVVVVYGGVVVVVIRVLLMRGILWSSPRSTTTRMRSRYWSHINMSSSSGSSSADIPRHGLPSRQMRVHLAGLGFVKQRRPRPLLLRSGWSDALPSASFASCCVAPGSGM